MKTIRTSLLAICLLFPFLGKAQCTASFTSSANGLTVTFNGTVSPVGGPLSSYYWWFSDGNSSSSVEDPTYTFSAPGNYTVCFSYYDPSTQCADSVCQTISVGSSVCNASFISIDTAGYTYFLGNSTAGPGAMYYWDFGDGNLGSGQNPWHQYANPGTYLACLTVYTANQVFCDSTCQTVVVTSSGGCNVDFTWIDSVGYAFFISSSTLGNGGNYYWDFGDGNYSTSMNPSHVYSTPGNYMVCVSVYDSLQQFCDSTCYLINVQSQASVGENSELLNSFAVSPNPADANVNLTFNAEHAGAATITWYDASGRESRTEEITLPGNGQVNYQVNTTEMPQGIYLLKLEVNGAVAWRKIALTHQ